MAPTPSRLSDRRSQPRPRPVARARGAVLGLALALFGAGATGCVETTVERDPDGGAAVREVPAAGAFRALSGGAEVGQVQCYGDTSDPQQHYFVIMNPWGQELGIVDGLGRVWRRRPHQEEPEAIGAGPLADGVRRLLGLDAEVELVAVEPGA